MAMDPIKPEVTIRLDRERRLRFTFGAARLFRKETGKSMFDSSVWQGIDEDLIPILVWCLLIPKDRDITVDDVADNIDLSALSDITSSMQKLYGASVSPASGEDDEHPTMASPSQN